MKVLQLTKHYPPYAGGIESVTFDIVENNRHRVEFYVLCCNDKRSSKIDLINGYTVQRSSRLTKLASTSISLALIRHLWAIRNDFDIIHIHFPDPMSCLALFLVRPKGKWIIHWHSDIVKQRRLATIFRPLQSWVLRRASAIIGTTENYVQHSKDLQPYREKVKVVPIGIGEAKLKMNEAAVESIQREFAGKKIVFSLGRHVYYKGLAYLIDAAKSLPDDIVILIGGTGHLTNSLRGQIEELGLKSKVVLLGRLSNEEVASYLMACDLFCLPSVEKSEAYGVVLLEAMAMGKPIVATEILGSGVTWVNKHGLTGLNVPVKDSHAISTAILKILSDEAFKASLAKNCLERFNSDFSAEKMAASIYQLYQDALSGQFKILVRV